jgi:hypothetical protein
MRERIEAIPEHVSFKDLAASGAARLASLYEKLFGGRRAAGRKRRWAFFE